MGALDGVGLRSTNVILTWAPSDQTFSKQGVVAPGSLQLPRPAAWTGEATPKTSVNAATVVVAMRTRIEFTFLTPLNFIGARPAPGSKLQQVEVRTAT